MDVTVRAVDATDAENCTSTWKAIAQQNVMSGTFMPTFNAILQNSGAHLQMLLSPEALRRCCLSFSVPEFGQNGKKSPASSPANLECSLVLQILEITQECQVEKLSSFCLQVLREMLL